MQAGQQMQASLCKNHGTMRKTSEILLGRGIPKKHILKSENKGESHPDHFGGLATIPKESYDP